VPAVWVSIGVTVVATGLLGMRKLGDLDQATTRRYNLLVIESGGDTHTDDLGVVDCAGRAPSGWRAASRRRREAASTACCSRADAAVVVAEDRYRRLGRE
jgi:hypothetical protein